jgi:hypothetical protein
MTELFRNQSNIHRQQMSQQPHHFGLPPSALPSNFRDQQQTQPSVPNMPNVGMQNSQLQYRNGMFPPFLGNAQPRHDMMSLAQNRLPQNGPITLMQQPQQSGPSTHPVQPASFPSADPSSLPPHPAVPHGGVMNAQAPHATQAGAQRNMSYTELSDRCRQNEAAIGPPEQSLNNEWKQKMQQATFDHKTKKETSAKFQAALLQANM